MKVSRICKKYRIVSWRTKWLEVDTMRRAKHNGICRNGLLYFWNLATFEKLITRKLTIENAAELHQKKILLSIWWNWKGVVFFELLPRNQTINSDIYCRQLNKFNAAVKEKRLELVNSKGVIFYHDNSTQHTSLATRQKLLSLGWEVILHPPYSPELALYDYYWDRT